MTATVIAFPERAQPLSLADIHYIGAQMLRWARYDDINSAALIGAADRLLAYAEQVADLLPTGAT